jgi:hypothetical protein
MNVSVFDSLVLRNLKCFAVCRVLKSMFDILCNKHDFVNE